MYLEREREWVTEIERERVLKSEMQESGMRLLRPFLEMDWNIMENKSKKGIIIRLNLEK